jgi:hypothetical protein
MHLQRSQLKNGSGMLPRVNQFFYHYPNLNKSLFWGTFMKVYAPKNYIVLLGVIAPRYGPSLGPPKKVVGFQTLETGVQVKALPALCH